MHSLENLEHLVVTQCKQGLVCIQANGQKTMHLLQCQVASLSISVPFTFSANALISFTKFTSITPLSKHISQSSIIILNTKGKNVPKSLTFEQAQFNTSRKFQHHEL